MNKTHIDDDQTSTIDEHLKLILEDDSVNNSELNVTSNDLPHWYNKQLYKEAQNYYIRNFLSINFASLLGLIALFSITSILKILIYTKQSITPCAAFKRYFETQLHIYEIYTSDANNSDSNWYKSMNVIRWKHNTSSARSKTAGIGPIYQRDMVLTQFAFAGYILMASKFFGICSKSAEDEAFNHFWRVNGYMLGIPNKLNLCRKTAVETRELCQKIVEAIYINSLNEASSDFYHIASITLNSLWYNNIHINEDSTLALTYRIHGIEYKKPLKWYSWLNMKCMELLFKLFLIPYVGTVIKMYFNCLYRISFFITRRFPVFAWAKFGKENVQINLYPKYRKL